MRLAKYCSQVSEMAYASSQPLVAHKQLIVVGVQLLLSHGFASSLEVRFVAILAVAGTQRSYV